jgi:hypothetical protein
MNHSSLLDASHQRVQIVASVIHGTIKIVIKSIVMPDVWFASALWSLTFDSQETALLLRGVIVIMAALNSDPILAVNFTP